MILQNFVLDLVFRKNWLVSGTLSFSLLCWEQLIFTPHASGKMVVECSQTLLLTCVLENSSHPEKLGFLGGEGTIMNVSEYISRP